MDFYLICRKFTNMIRISLIFLISLSLYLHWSDATYGYSDSFHNWCNSTTCQQFPKICPCPGFNESSNQRDDQCDNINNCTVYSFSINGAVTSFCGECGMLGSVCNVNNVTCQPPGYCYDRYCHCPIGNTFEGICIHYQAIANSELTIALIVTLIALVILLRLISSHKFIRRCCCLPIMNRYRDWRGRSRMLNTDQETICGHNPNSGTKSAAFTIATREFITTSTDPDLEWALELSMQVEVNSTSNVQSTVSAGTSTSGTSDERDSMGIPGSSGEPRQQPTLLRNRQQQLTNSYSTLPSSSNASSDHWSSPENPDADVATSATAVLGNSTRGFSTDSLKRNRYRTEIIVTHVLEDSPNTFSSSTYLNSSESA